MAGRFAVVVGFLLVCVGAVGSVAAADPPQPGTTDSGLNESEEATLWSNMPADHWETDTDRTMVHEIATESDLTFTEPPSTAHRWTEYAHGMYRPGGADSSIYPASADTESSSYIKDAHATVFAAQPATRVYIEPGVTRQYVAPEGELFGTVDYRIEIPSDSRSRGWSYSWRLRQHEIESVRMYADGTKLAETSGDHRPRFEYQLADDVDRLQLEADIEATIEETARPPADSNRSTRVRTHRDSVTVSDTVAVDVYRIDATAHYAAHPDGQMGVSIAQSTPWQGYTLDAAATTEVRGIWRFFTARDTAWDRLIESTAGDTADRESNVLPVAVHAYPAAAGPRAKPEFGGPELLETWGDTSDSPANSLPEHVGVDVVEHEYNDTYGVAVQADSIDPDAVTVRGLVYGTEAEPETIFSEPHEIRKSNLSATIIDRSDGEATVLLTLEDEETGDPIVLEGDERVSPVAPGGETGSILIDNRRVETNESGQVVATLSDPGSYTARYDPASWLDVAPAYTGDSATVRWHSLSTISAWLDLAIRVGMILLPFFVVLYAGRQLGQFISGGYR